MTILQVTPNSSELLQDVANSLGKAKKVVIITGAGISTNSGIPDFRSENGLYSLIQAQFERAEAGHGRSQDYGHHYLDTPRNIPCNPLHPKSHYSQAPDFQEPHPRLMTHLSA
ncbi:putative hst3 protein [Daldinia childiae]|uniref:putative hst3 protein n=1 Tax=Daldinia childiae TaxID=326645 RepID=UPI001445C2F8|nr:putative hst3 protein [Daldinia childiae]KAF3065971.1 putative hst3 protein [Daldinia childiae]